MLVPPSHFQTRGQENDKPGQNWTKDLIQRCFSLSVPTKTCWVELTRSIFQRMIHIRHHRPLLTNNKWWSSSFITLIIIRMIREGGGVISVMHRAPWPAGFQILAIVIEINISKSANHHLSTPWHWRSAKYDRRAHHFVNDQSQHQGSFNSSQQKASWNRNTGQLFRKSLRHHCRSTFQ